MRLRNLVLPLTLLIHVLALPVDVHISTLARRQDDDDAPPAPVADASFSLPIPPTSHVIVISLLPKAPPADSDSDFIVLDTAALVRKQDDDSPAAPGPDAKFLIPIPSTSRTLTFSLLPAAPPAVPDEDFVVTSADTGSASSPGTPPKQKRGSRLRRRQDDDNDPDEDPDEDPDTDTDDKKDVGDTVASVFNSLGDAISNFSPLEDGQFETDADASDGNDSGTSNSETANGILGGGTSGSANNNDTTVVTSSQCNLFECTSAAASADENGVETSASSDGLLGRKVDMTKGQEAN